MDSFFFVDGRNFKMKHMWVVVLRLGEKKKIGFNLVNTLEHHLRLFCFKESSRERV